MMESDYVEECPHCGGDALVFDVGWGRDGYTQYEWNCLCHNEHCRPDFLHDVAKKMINQTQEPKQ